MTFCDPTQGEGATIRVGPRRAPYPATTPQVTYGHGAGISLESISSAGTGASPHRADCSKIRIVCAGALLFFSNQVAPILTWVLPYKFEDFERGLISPEDRPEKPFRNPVLRLLAEYALEQSGLIVVWMQLF